MVPGATAAAVRCACASACPSLRPVQIILLPLPLPLMLLLLPPPGEELHVVEVGDSKGRGASGHGVQGQCDLFVRLQA